jgi:hypothetical protein
MRAALATLFFGIMLFLGIMAGSPVAQATPQVVTSEATRTARQGIDALLATYLTLDKECKIGDEPKIEPIEGPSNGIIRMRPQPINLRDVPGAPRRNCVGTSPSGIGVFYRANRKFKGEDRVRLRITYPEGHQREITLTITVK